MIYLFQREPFLNEILGNKTQGDIYLYRRLLDRWIISTSLRCDIVKYALHLTSTCIYSVETCYSTIADENAKLKPHFYRCH